MLDAALASGVAQRRAVFEVFARALPPGRRYGAVAGVGRLTAAMAAFRFDASQLSFLEAKGLLTPASSRYLADYRFGGTVHAYEEGELYFPGSPLLTVEGTFGEALLMETLVLSVLNHDSAVASAASRMVTAAGVRPLIEMGSRRTHEQAAVAAARAAYGVGFASTSNLEAGRLFGIPTAGTAAHALVLAHADERTAFEAQVEALGTGTTLLVDTFDTEQGIRTAVDVAGTGLGAVRIDSGDLASEARRARKLLDSLGATGTRIVVSGDLDEHGIQALRSAPVDAYGVGTKVVGGSGHPTANMVYKLVAMEDSTGAVQPVAKRSPGKQGYGGRKWAFRLLGPSGTVVAECLKWKPPEQGPAGGSGSSGRSGDDDPRRRPLQRTYMKGGEICLSLPLDHVRRRHAESVGELPPEGRDLSPGPPWVEAEMDLHAADLWRSHGGRLKVEHERGTCEATAPRRN